MDILSFLDEESKRAYELVASAFEPSGAELYFAGGCVRDIIIGATPKDFDIEVYGVSKELFEGVLESVGAVGVGKSFFVYRYANLDISLPRGETKIGVGHSGFEAFVVQDKAFACSRRDFTINAMLINAKTGELIDFYGGLSDLNAKILRMVSGDSFGDDSLRVLRAVQFAARFGFKIEPVTLEVCRQTPLCDISKSRIFAEFEKLFGGAYPINGAYYFFRLGVSKKLFGFESDFKTFLKLSKALKKSYCFFGGGVENLFLYELFSVYRLNKREFLDRIGAPKRSYRAFELQKRAPKRVSERFLIGLSLKLPISKWLGLRSKEICETAVNLSVWESEYKPEITHQKLISMGYKNKEISKNYSLLLSHEIREKFKG